MATVKDYLKIIVTVVITFLATSFLNAVINKTNAKQADLIIVEEKAYNYTDKAIETHASNEDKRMALLVKYLDQRFDNVEKLIDSK